MITTSNLRIALANVAFPASRDESLEIVTEAIRTAANGGASIVCFPECIVPGYRIGAAANPQDMDWLREAWATVDALAAKNSIWVLLGTERVAENGLRITVRVTNHHGHLVGFQDKVQLDPTEETTYAAGDQRHIFDAGSFKFGIVICHEAWRYPETVRWAARNGAHIVFHPHVEILGESQSFPKRFADPLNSFHEKAAICRAAENTCYFATVNCALPKGCATTSAVIDPEGHLLKYHPYGNPGVLFCDIDPTEATGLLAHRLRPETI